MQVSSNFVERKETIEETYKGTKRFSISRKLISFIKLTMEGANQDKPIR